MTVARSANIRLPAAGGGLSLPDALRRLPGFGFRLGLLLLLALLAAWSGYAATERYLGVLEPDRVIAIDDFPEISGIAYWPERDTLIGVGDNGEIAELSLQGRVLRKRMHPGRDFEDVVLLPGARRVLAIDEQEARLLTLSLEDFSVVAEREVPAGLAVTRHRNKSFEGLALAGAPPQIVLGNEFPPAIVRADGGGRLPRTSLLGARSLSGVIAGPEGELLVVSREHGLMLLDADGRPSGKWRPIEYHHIEGAALVPGFGLVLCVDRSPGVLLVFSSIKDWPSLRHALAS